MKPSFIDSKGRRRWRRNEEIAAKVKELHDFLVIGGYDELHATQYPRLALTLSRYPESVETLAAEGRLSEIPGVAGTITGLLEEILDTGTCSKLEEWARTTPITVLELTKIPRLGAKTAKRLYHDHGIDGLDALRKSMDDGTLGAVAGFGPKTLANIRRYLQGVPAGRKRSRRAG